ncbi:MAG: ElyC/SanA/YdcF family protein [Patescibacteria group bacterium]
MSLLDWIFGWMLVPDNLPKEQAMAIFCHTYGTTPGFKSLTAVSQAAMEKAIELIVKGKSYLLILPVGSCGENEERKIRQEIAQKAGIANQISFLRGVKSTYDEAAAIGNLIVGGNILVVADRYHMRRSLQIFRACLPGTKLYNASSVCLKYDEPAVPPSLFSFIQSRQIRSKFVSILWNNLFYLLTPILVKRS